MAKRDGDDEIRRLYSLPLDEFVAERDATAKRLREAGDTEGAKSIKGLRKPNVPAAAINRAVAAAPKAATKLIETGAELEAAQESALAGGDADSLRDAVGAYGDAVEKLMETVEEELAGAGGAAAVDRARETLRAVAGDPELRADLAAGRLVRDREAVGLAGGVAPSGAVSRRAPAPKKRPKRGSGDAAAERKRAEQALRRAERSLDAATERAKSAERHLERTRRALADAEAEHEDALREREAREAELDEARSALDR
jgi:hypothetical protein